MTGAAQSLIASFAARGPSLTGTVDLSAGGAAPATFNASFTVTTQGNVTYDDGSGPTKWFSPQTAGIGASYYYRLTISSGNNPNIGLNAATLYQGSVDRTWGWETSSGVLAATGTLSIYSDAGGTILVASCPVVVNVEST